MRAAVLLLCLLHTAFGQYSWYELDEIPQTFSVCKEGEGSCGCCLMVREVERLKTLFNTSLNSLEQEYLKTNKTVSNMDASRTAFSVALLGNSRFQCIGPFTMNTTITYKHVFLNLGNHYSVNTGIFTVPHSGVYSLALTVYSDAGAPITPLKACAGLQINGKVVAGSVNDQNKDDQEDSASVVIAIHLKAGDKVAVNLPPKCFICDDSSHYNTFSGFLLYVTA